MVQRSILLLLLWLLAAAAPARAQTFEFGSALSAASASPAFPEDAPALTVGLPDEWARTRPLSRGPVWYRVPFTSPTTLPGDDRLALYIERVCSTFEVRLNGHRIYSGGRMVEPLSNECNQPQLIALSSALLRAEGNTLDIMVAGHPLGEVGSRHRAAALSALVIGPQHELAARQARRAALQVSAPQALSAALLLVGGFIFGLGLANRSERHLAYFGALAVGWALKDAPLWWPDLPLNHSVVEFLLSMLTALMAWAAVQFLFRDARARHRVADIGLPVQCAVMALTLVLAGAARLNAVAGLWSVALGLEVLAAAAWHQHHQWHRPSGWMVTVLLAAAALSGGVEFAEPSIGAWPLATHLTQMTVSLLFMLVGLRLVQQHGQALYLAVQGKAQLEQRVREATIEIEHNFRQLAELHVEQVTERERKRIAADLHDDLGAKLLTIVHTSESERISTLARGALEEMRLSVRGLSGKPVRLADALGDWRAEVVSRLGQAGIDGRWEAPEDLPQTLSARAYVQTTRILREATSNIIKHSGATQCAVMASVADGDFQLVVKDNGAGIASEVESRLDRGHGLAGMKNRAKQLQGQCLVESAAGYGTVIRLTLPLDRAAQST